MRKARRAVIDCPPGPNADKTAGSGDGPEFRKPEARTSVPFKETGNLAFALLVAQTIVLVAATALLGQAMVGIFNWRARQQNVIYKMFELVASPFVKLIRLVTPKIVLDQHIPIATFMVLLFAYFWLGFEHRASCRADVSQAGCEKWVEAWSPGAGKQ
jgi:uncharacterized protein YggT (Ycf19 family)